MEEQEQIRVGQYCESLLNDNNFNELVKIVESSLSLDMLSAEDAEGREKVHQTYKGLLYLLDTAKQFVLNKDQIALRLEQENNQ